MTKEAKDYSAILSFLWPMLWEAHIKTTLTTRGRPCIRFVQCKCSWADHSFEVLCSCVLKSEDFPLMPSLSLSLLIMPAGLFYLSEIWNHFKCNTGQKWMIGGARNVIANIYNNLTCGQKWTFLESAHKQLFYRIPRVKVTFLWIKAAMSQQSR